MADLDNLYILEKSFDIQINLGKFTDDNDESQKQTQEITLPSNNFNIYESFPIILNGQQVQQNTNGANSQEPPKQENKGFSLLESVPIQINNQIVEENCRVNDNNIANTNKTNSNESAQSNQNQLQMGKTEKNQSDNLSGNNKKMNQNKPGLGLGDTLTDFKGLNLKINVNNIAADKKLNLKGQGLAETQIINETEKTESPHKQSFEPDIFSNTNQKKKIVQHFELKLLAEQQQDNKKPAKILQNEGKERVLIGRRQPSDILIKDETISSKHATITWKPQEQHWCLSDEGSTNGTYLIINNAAIKENDEILIGLHIVKIVKITKTFPIEIQLEFENSVEKVPNVTVIAKVDIGSKFMIGKKHQRNLEDFLMCDDHCYIFFENKKVKIQNCENVFYKTAKKLDKTKVIDLNKGNIIRIGFFNQYEFNPYSEIVDKPKDIPNPQLQNVSSQPQCKNCSSQSRLFKLIPCNHDQICLICAQGDICPICGDKILDFL